MKRFLIIAALSLPLAGCGAASKVSDFVSTVTQTITNPVGEVDIYRAKNLYLATLKVANNWREYCWSKPYSTIVADPIMRPVCQERRATTRTLQAANRKASAALKAAETFIRNNPSGNAVTYVTAAWNAVNDFKNAIPAK